MIYGRRKRSAEPQLGNNMIVINLNQTKQITYTVKDASDHSAVKVQSSVNQTAIIVPVTIVTLAIVMIIGVLVYIRERPVMYNVAALDRTEQTNRPLPLSENHITLAGTTDLGTPV